MGRASVEKTSTQQRLKTEGNGSATTRNLIENTRVRTHLYILKGYNGKDRERRITTEIAVRQKYLRQHIDEKKITVRATYAELVPKENSEQHLTRRKKPHHRLSDLKRLVTAVVSRSWTRKGNTSVSECPERNQNCHTATQYKQLKYTIHLRTRVHAVERQREVHKIRKLHSNIFRPDLIDHRTIEIATHRTDTALNKEARRIKTYISAGICETFLSGELYAGHSTRKVHTEVACALAESSTVFLASRTLRKISPLQQVRNLRKYYAGGLKKLY